MRARTKRVMRNINLSEHTQPIPETMPPGAPVQIGEEQPKDGSAYPSATEVTEETQEQLDAEAEKRVERAKTVSAPRRLSDREKQLIGILLDMDIVKDALSVTDVVIPIEMLPEHIRLSFFEVGKERNIFQRGLAEPVYDGEPKAIVGLRLREVTLDLYSRLTRVSGDKTAKVAKPKGESRATGGRASSSYPDNLRMRKMKDNPRVPGTMGYYSWQIYQDGMNYKEYMASKNYEPALSDRTGASFRGPGRNHWEWDLQHGFIALYREDENELLEDGSPNPKYWAINNNVR